MRSYTQRSNNEPPTIATSKDIGWRSVVSLSFQRMQRDGVGDFHSRESSSPSPSHRFADAI
jgi:hypothetical protein